MNMKQVKVSIERASDGTFSAYMDDAMALPYGLVGVGNCVTDAIADWNKCYEEMKTLFESNGENFVEAQFKFSYDLPSFLVYYADLISYRGLAKITGISPAQLSQYVSGYRHPSPKTTAKIQAALNALGKELSQLELC